jgi:hypothetical protein
MGAHPVNASEQIAAEKNAKNEDRKKFCGTATTEASAM